MDEPSSLLALPRIRLTRNIGQYVDDGGATPIAGPSRLRDSDEDSQLTPRIPIQNNFASTTPAFPTDTPAARLRALLAKVPNETPLSKPIAPPSPSEPDSDYYPAHLNTTNTPHESLRELFTRALREPGDTPEKPRRRRNSIDLSEVDDSPRLSRAQKERAKSRGKRKSFSDEELEKASSEWNHSRQRTSGLTPRQRTHKCTLRHPRSIRYGNDWLILNSMWICKTLRHPRIVSAQAVIKYLNLICRIIL
jgi:hypothetical protein